MPKKGNKNTKDKKKDKAQEEQYIELAELPPEDDELENEIKAPIEEKNQEPIEEKKQESGVNKDGDGIFENDDNLIDDEQKEEDLKKNTEFFKERMKTYNTMYGVSIDANDFLEKVSDAWSDMTNEDKDKAKEGEEKLRNIFLDIVSQAAKIEKQRSYEQVKPPEFDEIIKSTNNLLRAAMFAKTDLFTNKARKDMFEKTFLGGVDPAQLSEKMKRDGNWRNDQRSDAAWEKQSMEAINIAIGWSEKERPINEMLKALKGLEVDFEKGFFNQREAFNTLAAAERLLMAQSDCMIEDIDNPGEKIPKWNHPDWKALVDCRDKLGIPRYASMRDLIQSEYHNMSKTMDNAYLKEVFEKDIVSEKAREGDSLESLKEQFTINRATLHIDEVFNEKEVMDAKMENDKEPIIVKECDEQVIQKNMPKVPPVSPLEKDNHLEYKPV